MGQFSTYTQYFIRKYLLNWWMEFKIVFFFLTANVIQVFAACISKDKISAFMKKTTRTLIYIFSFKSSPKALVSSVANLQVHLAHYPRKLLRSI